MIYRKDYDKPNRCPGWSGAGIKPYPWEKSEKTNCTNGNSGYYDSAINFREKYPRFDGYDYLIADLQFHKCAECGLMTWPYATRFIDPDYWVNLKASMFISGVKNTAYHIKQAYSEDGLEGATYEAVFRLVSPKESAQDKVEKVFDVAWAGIYKAEDVRDTVLSTVLPKAKSLGSRFNSLKSLRLA